MSRIGNFPPEPAGFMDQERIDGMSRELTEAVLAADGSAGDGSGPRLFCIIEEIPLYHRGDTERGLEHRWQSVDRRLYRQDSRPRR
jgi:hypothetical protein